MPSSTKESPVSVEEYLQLERTALDKSEYFRGEIYAMPYNGACHSLVSANVIGELGTQIKGRSGRVYSSDLRIEVPATGLCTYCDVMVICGPVTLSPHADDMVTNPAVIVEVFSESTEAYDRGNKFANYRALGSLREYVLVSQNEPLVDVFFRLPDGKWQITFARGMDASVPVQSMGIILLLAEIYRGVEFPEQPPLKTLAS